MMDNFEKWKMQDFLTFQCGDSYKTWIQYALECIPSEIQEEVDIEHITFVGMDILDAGRISKQIRCCREIIVLSDRIMPVKTCPTVDDKEIRYFMFCVLHEIAHIYRDHKTIVFDGITSQEQEQQEKEADELAFTWYNAYVEKMDNSHLQKLTSAEIAKMKEKNQRIMQGC